LEKVSHKAPKIPTVVGRRERFRYDAKAVTGLGLSAEDYLVIGERVLQLRHLFNVREGVNPVRNFAPHGRFLENPLRKRVRREVSLSITVNFRKIFISKCTGIKTLVCPIATTSGSLGCGMMWLILSKNYKGLAGRIGDRPYIQGG